MKYKDLKHNIRLSGLNITEFASIIKINPKSIFNLSKEEDKEVPKNIAIISTLFAEMAKNNIDFISPLEQITIQKHKSRNVGIFGGNLHDNTMLNKGEQ